MSALSGCLWAAIPYYYLHESMSPYIWGGIIASPFIGTAMGLIYCGACAWSLWLRILLSLATLYLAVFLFGLAVGICDAARPIPNRLFDGVVAQTIFAFLWGVTIPGLFVVLWPMAFLNHTLVCRFGWRRKNLNPTQ
jgi:hypothetical protein